MSLPVPPLLVITGRGLATRNLEDIAAAAFAGGCRWLSLRENDLSPPERLALLRRLVALGRTCGASVTVHADVDAAIAAGAAGVHLPAGGDAAAARQLLGPGALIGISAHSENEVSRAAGAGADYVTISPIFVSHSKLGYGPVLGLAELGRITRRATLPLIALGGIGPAQVAACLQAGAAGVAVLGGVMAAADPALATSALVAGLPLAAVSCPGRAGRP
ncbi:MAG TPA: thiamine phosphate synthase [Stellaceae bacterium]|nr:thiamine phosphate synthase [Stellaceae bacterium]